MASQDDNQLTSMRLLWLLPCLKRANWVAGEIEIEPSSSEVNLTPLGSQRLQELYQVHRVLYPGSIGEARLPHDGPARAGAEATMNAIFCELEEANPNEFHTAAPREFLMAYVRSVLKPKNPPRCR